MDRDKDGYCANIGDDDNWIWIEITVLFWRTEYKLRG